jgi:tRNA pseudouridine55 synthase
MLLPVDSEMDGILLIDKPGGMTSHDVVDRIRSLVPGVRIGHAGTLDPDANGLLIILLGKATKVSRFLMGLDKEYVFTIQLGIETDTLDRWGKTVQVRSIEGISESDILAAASRFKGRYQQIAPSVSALKHKGVPLYKMARRGEPTPTKTRVVVIDVFEVLDIAGPFVTIRVVCTTGTYVRSLARDVGRYLGCGASVFCLRRLTIGPFGVDRAVALEDLGVGHVGVSARMLSMEESLKHMPRVCLKNGSVAKIKMGGQPSAQDLLDPNPEFEGDYVTLADEAGNIFGIARRSERAPWVLRTERIL